MDTAQKPILDKETDQSKMLSPSLENNSASFSRTSFDLQRLTPSQFGITVQTFSLLPSNSKEKSRLAQLKARRRSNVGVRGSPETNSLIRFIARQKMKNSSNCQTPEQLVRGSPFLPRVASTLKQKIASFQSLMGVEESEVHDLTPRQGDNTGGCMKTRDYLSDKYHPDEGKENNHQGVSPAPCKKRRVGPLKGCEVQIRDAYVPDFYLKGTDKEGEKELVAESKDDVNRGTLPSSETVEEPSPPLRGYRAPLMSLEHNTFSSENNQQNDVFEPQNPNRALPSDLTSASPEESSSAFQFSTPPFQKNRKSTEENVVSGTSAAKKKKKQVHFGRPLSPELFDRQLPPSTPLQKGGTPARASTPGGILKKKSAFKTPQRNESCTSRAQPDHSSDFGASPVFAMSHNCRVLHFAEDGVEEFEKVTFPPKEDNDSAVMTELMNNAQTNLEDSFHDEAFPPLITEVKSETRPATQLNSLEDLSVEKQAEAVSKATARLRNREKKTVPESTNGLPAVRRKRKLPEMSKPVRRSTRSAAKPSETIKSASTAANRWKKEVNLSLYGSREYASKNPGLSPITELFIHQSEEAERSPPTSSADDSAYFKDGESASNGHGATVSIGESPSGAPLYSGKRVLGKNHCPSRPRATRQNLKKASVSIDHPPCVEPQLQTNENPEKEIAPVTAVSIGVPSEAMAAGAEEHCSLPIADTPSTQTDTHSEGHPVVDGSTSACLLGEQTCAVTLTVASPGRTQRARNVSRRRRCSLNLAGKRPRQEMEAQLKANSYSKCGSPENGVQDNSGLASWQGDFNFEDVFTHVPSRGQRSVRRSLRNQLNTDNNEAGLAWVPTISPEIKKGTSRKSRTRRFSPIRLSTGPV